MIPAERSHLQIAAKTHPGMRGKNNEDRYAVSAFRLEGDESLPAVFAVISDGIGGHRAGEVAAEIAVETISRDVAKSDASQPLQTLKEAIGRASQEIYIQSDKDDGMQGMGATCACVWVIDDRFYIAYVGDSRIYFIRSGAVRQLTIDHTWVQEALDAGILTPEQAEGHPNTHVIRRYLGSSTPVEPDIRLRLKDDETVAESEGNQGLRLLPGDQILLCSDGLTDLVSDDEILELMKNEDQEASLDGLIDLANQRGGHDNITIITLGVPRESLEPAPAAPAPQRRKNKLVLGCLGVSLLIVLLAVLLGGAYFLYRGSLSPTPAATDTSTALPTDLILFPSESLSPSDTPPSTPALPSPSQTEATEVDPGPSPPAVTLTNWPTNTPAP